MANRIRILDPITANQIAAGEVVERPASVVKELVENAVDAGASRIEIEVAGAGSDLIRVTDNGCGMNREDAVLALQRHATSKISAPADLAKIGTLGFRGEALPSIASVSRLELMTREPHVLAGTRVKVAGGQVEAVEDAGCPAGTTVIVRDLFFNTPARRKFLKSDATELGQISDLLGRMAMAYPEIAFKLVHLTRVLLQTPGSGNLLDPVLQIFGKELAREMIPVKAAGENIVVEGYLGRPHLARSSRNYQSFFINGRYVRSKVLTRAVADGYHTLVPSNRYPMVVLNLALPVNTVDVNVHPSKLEVRFTREGELAAFVTAAVRSTLADTLLIPGLVPEREAPPGWDSVPRYPGEQVEWGLQHLHPGGGSELREAPAPGMGSADQSIGHEVRIPEPLERSETSGETFTFEQPDLLPEIESKVREPAEAEQPESVAALAGMRAGESTTTESTAANRTSKLPDLVPLGQIELTYIAARGPEGLYILDQHAAHERINYELLWERAARSGGETQLLLEPLTLELTNQELELLVENIALFRDLGFLLEFFGGNTFLLRGRPVDLAESDVRTVIRDLLDMFMDGPRAIEPRKLREEYIYMLACKSSIKARESLNQAEMEHLIWQLGRTENPFSCPHGRPTLIAITSSELAKRFQRI